MTTANRKQTHKIAVSINKGGATKTTTAVHLAAGLAELGKTVLLIDADPQSEEGNVAKHLGVKGKDLTRSLYHFIVEGDKEAIYPARENLYIIRGGFELNTLRRDIDNRQIGGQYVFAEAFQPLEQIFDFIIFDTAPSWDSLNINTLFYADEMIIPINLEGMTVSNLLDYLNRNLREIHKYRPQTLKWGYALPTRHDKRTRQSAELLDQLGRFFNNTLMANPDLQGKYANTMLCAPIRYNVSISEAAAHGMTVFEYAAKSRGAEDYRNFARSVLGE